MGDHVPIQMLWADTHRHRALCMVHPMKNLGVHVRVVDDGWTALRELKTDPDGYRVAVLHVALTGMGSRELSRQLRRERPELPIVYLGIPTWSVGARDRALELPLSPVALHEALQQLGGLPAAANGPPPSRLRLTG